MHGRVRIPARIHAQTLSTACKHNDFVFRVCFARAHIVSCVCVSVFISHAVVCHTPHCAGMGGLSLLAIQGMLSLFFEDDPNARGLVRLVGWRCVSCLGYCVLCEQCALVF